MKSQMNEDSNDKKTSDMVGGGGGTVTSFIFVHAINLCNTSNKFHVWAPISLKVFFFIFKKCNLFMNSVHNLGVSFGIHL